MVDNNGPGTRLESLRMAQSAADGQMPIGAMDWHCSGIDGRNETREGIRMTDEKIEKMRQFIAYYANCPCCDKSDVCEDGCEFKDDDEAAYDIMQLARESLEVAK